jgi:hypothetical protein
MSDPIATIQNSKFYTSHVPTEITPTAPPHSLTRPPSPRPLRPFFLGLQTLRLEREVCESDINSLMHEKESIRQILPKLLEQLKDMKEGIDEKQREVNTFDRAIEEIERQYGHVLFTSAFYANNDGK